MDYYRQDNEITFQVELYQAATDLLESWGHQYETQLEFRYKNCIFDIIVAKFGKVVLIIETKKLENGHHPNYKTPQIKKYSRFGIPVVICGHNKRIIKVAGAIVSFVTLDQPEEKFFNEDMWKKKFAVLKFMATTREKKKRRKILGIK